MPVIAGSSGLKVERRITPTVFKPRSETLFWARGGGGTLSYIKSLLVAASKPLR
jgi:hypothetical protein